MSMSDINPGQAVYATDEVSSKRCRFKGENDGRGGRRGRKDLLDVARELVSCSVESRTRSATTSTLAAIESAI
jgi:hypothetical protein